CTTEKEEWIVPVKVNGTIIPFKIDTGAQANLLSLEDYKTLTVKTKIHPVKKRSDGYTGECVPVKSGCIQTQKSADTNTATDSGKRDCFEGLGCLPGVHKICVDKSGPPVVHPCRKIPFALRKKLKDELARMEKLELDSYALTTCLDPTCLDLNKAIRREHFKLSTREEIMAQFAGAKWFRKLDASLGFWQLRLDEESSKLFTFNMPEGRYRFLRLPCGILSAPEVYHKTIHMIYIPGVETMMDDIITRGVNLKLNKDKCEFGVNTLTFVGDVVSEEGARPDPRKTRFLGMVTYLAKFVPQLSIQSTHLRNLIEQKNEWIWSHQHKQCFLKLKQILTHEPVLKFYDPEKNTRISADTSQYGLGAMLLQQHDKQWLPVAYASRALTSAQSRYAQIENEFLASMYALETDHKPLVSIMSKPLNDCPVRIHTRLTPCLEQWKRRTEKGAEIQAYVDMILTCLPVTTDRTEQIRTETNADETMTELTELTYEPLMTHPVPHRPYKLVTDYLSNYPEVGALQSTSTKAVISYLKCVFARHGVPCEPFSDNGPQFSSCEFADFAKEWGFRHLTSSPNYPKPTGLAESSFKTKGVLIYWSGPLQNGLSLAQMQMGQCIRSNLQVNEDLLMPQKRTQSQRSKRGDKSDTKMALGTMVHLRDVSTETWRQQGQVEEEVAPRFYKIQTESG
ncbi:hypothetical protein Q8A73_006228, partial [Channa argus]